METAIERVRAFVKDRDWDQFHTPDNLGKIHLHRGRGAAGMLSVGSGVNMNIARCVRSLRM